MVKKLLNLINSEVGKEAMHSIPGYAVSPDEKSVGGRDNCGKIIISIFTGEPYDSWEVENILPQGKRIKVGTVLKILLGELPWLQT